MSMRKSQILSSLPWIEARMTSWVRVRSGEEAEPIQIQTDESEWGFPVLAG